MIKEIQEMRIDPIEITVQDMRSTRKLSIPVA